MGGQIIYIFGLKLRVTFYLIANIVYKGLIVSEIYFQKPFKFGPNNELKRLILGFILNPSTTNAITQEKKCKQNLI